MITNKEIKTYISEIKMLLPIYTKKERQFLKTFSDNICTYADSNSDSSIEDVVNVFGSPSEIVRGYIDSMELDTLINAIATRRILRKITIIILLLAITILALFGGFYYKGYQYYKDTVITENETVIVNE